MTFPHLPVPHLLPSMCSQVAGICLLSLTAAGWQWGYCHHQALLPLTKRSIHADSQHIPWLPNLRVWHLVRHSSGYHFFPAGPLHYSLWHWYCSPDLPALMCSCLFIASSPLFPHLFALLDIWLTSRTVLLHTLPPWHTCKINLVILLSTERERERVCMPAVEKKAEHLSCRRVSACLFPIISTCLSAIYTSICV